LALRLPKHARKAKHLCDSMPAILEKASLIVDTRNALKGFKSEKIVRL
jgi:hypothetical protein